MQHRTMAINVYKIESMTPIEQFIKVNSYNQKIEQIFTLKYLDSTIPKEGY